MRASKDPGQIARAVIFALLGFFAASVLYAMWSQSRSAERVAAGDQPSASQVVASAPPAVSPAVPVGSVSAVNPQYLLLLHFCSVPGVGLDGQPPGYGDWVNGSISARLLDGRPKSVDRVLQDMRNEYCGGQTRADTLEPVLEVDSAVVGDQVVPVLSVPPAPAWSKQQGDRQ